MTPPNSSHEQADGVQRINEAIRYLDVATQQNAALVGESFSASRTLQDQADMLFSRALTFTVQQPMELQEVSLPDTSAPASPKRAFRADRGFAPPLATTRKSA
jgi:hypothetical protein